MTAILTHPTAGAFYFIITAFLLFVWYAKHASKDAKL